MSSTTTVLPIRTTTIDSTKDITIKGIRLNLDYFMDNGRLIIKTR
jgi:hypothetical protein